MKQCSTYFRVTYDKDKHAADSTPKGVDKWKMNGLTILGLLLFIIPVQLFYNYITSDNVDEPELNYDQSL